MQTDLWSVSTALATRALLPEVEPSFLRQALQALRDLAGARWAHSLVVHRGAGVSDRLDGPALAFLRDAGCAALAMAALAEDALSARGRLVWIARPDGDGAVLLMSGCEQGGQVQVVVLGFAEAPAHCRLRLGDHVAPLLALVDVLLHARSEATEQKRRELAAAAALDDLDHGVVAVRSDRSLLLMNRVVRTLLAGDGPLQLHRGFLRPVDHREAIRFHMALDTVIEGRGRQPAEALMMLLAGDRPHPGIGSTMLMIAPAQHDGAGVEVDGAAAFIHVFRPDIADVRGLEPFCHLLGLSGAETRLVAELLVGRTVAEAATSMRVKLATARSYLKQVFAKTGTHRQTDLVALLHRYTLTARGRFSCRAA